MNQALRKAIGRLLQQLEQGDDIIEDLLLIQVDWGDHTPPVSDELAEIRFQGQQWPLVFTDSELVVRRILCHATPDRRAIIVLRGDDDLELPLDIRARAHQGACFRLGLRHRLYALTERDWPAEVDYAEWRPSMERHFDALVAASGQVPLKLGVSRSDLEVLLVQAAFGLMVEGHQPAQLLAYLVAFQRKTPTLPTDLELALFQGQLRLHQLERPRMLTWAAEEAGRAEELVRTGVMMGAEQWAQRLPNWGPLNRLRALLVNERQFAEDQAVSAVTELSTTALLHLHSSTRQAVVRAAEEALEGVLPPDSYNPWFPSALEREIVAVARQLAARDPAAPARIARLREHLFASQARARLDVLDQMAALVTRWEPAVEPGDSLVTADEWATWYARCGSRMDLAALKLMHYQHQGTGLEETMGRLVNSFWRWRDHVNGAFARRFLDHYEAAIHDRQSGVFGTHRILDWIVKPRLQEGGRVLLLVVDGMGLPAFRHLLDEWAAQTPPVYAQSAGPALALLPSVTAVSRKGLFLNALPTDRLDDEQTYELKARAAEAQTLERACQGHAVKFYNKTNLGNGHQLLESLQFGRADLIAVVLNAIDDDIKSTTTTVRLPHLEDMGPLQSAVRVALDAGWAVVMTADHGHTWHRGRQLRRGEIVPGGGERFAPVGSEKGLPEDALVTQDAHIIRLQEGKKVALLTGIGTYFGRQPRRGYHGGAGLEEVVVPCAFLTHDAPTVTAGPEDAARSGGESPLPAGYDPGGVILTLPDGRVTSLQLPFALSPGQIRLLQALARLGQASEADLRQAVGTRRVGGPLAALRDRLAAEGLDYIESVGTGSEGAIYRFRAEMLP